MSLDFRCQRCSVRVFVAAVDVPREPPMCLQCAWLLETISDPKERTVIELRLRNGEIY